MPYKAIKKFEFDGVVFKIGDTVPDRLIVDRLINASTLVEDINDVKIIVESPKEELLLETPSAVEITVEDIPKELIVETEVSEVVEVTPTEEKPSKNKNKK
jgi:hypothetical protein